MSPQNRLWVSNTQNARSFYPRMKRKQVLRKTREERWGNWLKIIDQSMDVRPPQKVFHSFSSHPSWLMKWRSLRSGSSDGYLPTSHSDGFGSSGIAVSTCWSLTQDFASRSWQILFVTPRIVPKIVSFMVKSVRFQGEVLCFPFGKRELKKCLCHKWKPPDRSADTLGSGCKVFFCE